MRNKAVLGVVRSQSETEGVIAELRASGFAVGDISVLFPNKGESRDFAHTQSSRAPEGAVLGGGIGGLVGAMLGLLAGMGVIAIPGFASLISAGPILAALSVAAVGAALGAVIGALVGLRQPVVQARAYDGKIEGGNILIAVHTEDANQIDVAKRVLRSNGAREVSVTPEAHVPVPHHALFSRA